MHEQKSAQSGFSLVELLVAILILAVGLLGLAELQITATRANSQSGAMLAASSFAQMVVEEIATMSSQHPMFADADNDSAPNDLEVSNATWPGSPVTVAGGGTYNITYDVITNFQGVTDLCQIIVRVISTQDLMSVGGNRQRSVTATTIKRST